MQVDIGNNRVQNSFGSVVTSSGLQEINRYLVFPQPLEVTEEPHSWIIRTPDADLLEKPHRHYISADNRSSGGDHQLNKTPLQQVYLAPGSRSHRHHHHRYDGARVSKTRPSLLPRRRPSNQDSAVTALLSENSALGLGMSTGAPKLNGIHDGKQSDSLRQRNGPRVNSRDAGASKAMSPSAAHGASGAPQRHLGNDEHIASNGKDNAADVVDNNNNNNVIIGNTKKGETPPVGPKLAQTRIKVGMRLKRWLIISRIGAGSFGETFTAMEVEGPFAAEDSLTVSADALELIDNLPPPEERQEVCVKVEQENKNVLRLEALALKKVQSCPQVVRYLASGCTNGMNYLVMEKLGPNLAELRRRSLHGTFNMYTTLKAGISCLTALRGVHEEGLVHRDIKPSNFVTGLPGTSAHSTCFLIDFGLARRFRRSTGEIRPPRDNAGFRGTSRYASVSSHRHLELGRVDDLWSLLFMLVEFATGTLPWRKYKDKDDIGQCKEESITPHLVRNLPREFQPFLAHLQTLSYEDEPDYELLLGLMNRAVERRGYPPGKPLDWELDPEAMLEADETPLVAPAAPSPAAENAGWRAPQPLSTQGPAPKPLDGASNGASKLPRRSAPQLAPSSMSAPPPDNQAGAGSGHRAGKAPLLPRRGSGVPQAVSNLSVDDAENNDENEDYDNRDEDVVVEDDMGRPSSRRRSQHNLNHSSTLRVSEVEVSCKPNEELRPQLYLSQAQQVSMPLSPHPREGAHKAATAVDTPAGYATLSLQRRNAGDGAGIEVDSTTPGAMASSQDLAGGYEDLDHSPREHLSRRGSHNGKSTKSSKHTSNVPVPLNFDGSGGGGAASGPLSEPQEMSQMTTHSAAAAPAVAAPPVEMNSQRKSGQSKGKQSADQKTKSKCNCTVM